MSESPRTIENDPRSVVSRRGSEPRDRSTRGLNADRFHRFEQGEFEITVLSDGYISVPDEIFVPEEWKKERPSILPRLNTHGALVHASTNIALVRSAKDVILFDVGGGERYQPSDGKLCENLSTAGIDKDSITKVVFTHAHPDHIAATLTMAGRLRFPNAAYFVGATEWDFWMDPNFTSSNPAGLHGFAQFAQRDLGAIRERVSMLKPGDDVVTGIRALDTPGHTPGHLSFEISGGPGLIVAADVATSEIVAFEHPEWTFGYDTIPDVAIVTRKRLLDRAASDKSMLLGFHWKYPGLGFAEARNGAFRFTPVGSN